MNSAKPKGPPPDEQGRILSHSRLHRALAVPELNVIVFAFLLNFVWEFLQTPFFRSVPQMPHWEAVKLCTVATIGDSAIMLVAFWCVAGAVGTRSWILRPGRRHLAAFAGIGVVATIVLEHLSRSAGRWEYSAYMPVIPFIEVGLLPLLQWLILPPLTAWFVRRQLTPPGEHRSRGRAH